MRKNSSFRADLDLYAYFEITGLNQDRLLNLLAKKDVKLYEIRKFSNKKMRLAIKMHEIEKFFAITRNLCYNIKRVKSGGKFYPVYRLSKRIGLTLGAIFFTVWLYFSSGFIYSVEYVGTGAVIKSEVTALLQSKGIGKYSKFSSIDLAVLSDEILAFSNKLSFAKCKKSGNRLIIELVLAQTNEKESLGKTSAIYSNVNGVIEDIKVYRGTAQKGIGDAVSLGELLVGGYAQIKDKTVEVSPIAYVSIICQKKERYESTSPNDFALAEEFARTMNADLDITTCAVDVIENNGVFVYEVTVSFRHQIYK